MVFITSELMKQDTESDSQNTEKLYELQHVISNNVVF